MADYLGCYNDAHVNGPICDGIPGQFSGFNGRVLPYCTSDETMTIDKCFSLAKSGGYTLFALQWGIECFVGWDVSLATSLGVSKACTFTCPGNTYTKCGGSWSNSLYQIYSYPPLPPPPLFRPPVYPMPVPPRPPPVSREEPPLPMPMPKPLFLPPFPEPPSPRSPPPYRPMHPLPLTPLSLPPPFQYSMPSASASAFTLSTPIILAIVFAIALVIGLVILCLCMRCRKSAVSPEPYRSHVHAPTRNYILDIDHHDPIPSAPPAPPEPPEPPHTRKPHPTHLPPLPCAPVLEDYPPMFVCPITQELMKDPVIASDGHTYERAAIEKWTREGRNVSPMTNEPLSGGALVPNRNLKSAIATYVGK